VNHEQILAAIQACVVSLKPDAALDQSRITRESILYEGSSERSEADLNLDSIDVAELMVLLEDECGIQVADDLEFGGCTTVGDLVDLVIATL
jgi:acyl carrier protein